MSRPTAENSLHYFPQLCFLLIDEISKVANWIDQESAQVLKE